MILHPVINEILDRGTQIGKALREGTLLPSDGAYLTSNYAFVYKDRPTPTLGMGHSGGAEPDSDDDAIWFTVSVYDEDRDGDLVYPKGRQGENYAKNPIWFFGHQSWEIPIGTSRAPDGRIMVVVEDNRIRQAWYPDKDDEDAMFLAGKVRRGVLNATSVAFVPVEAYRRDQERKEYDKARTHNQQTMMPPGWFFKVWDHTETSIVGVGSNPGAIRDSLDSEKSFITPRLQKALQPFAAQPKGLFRGWGPLPDKDGCYFDGKSWWCPVPEKAMKEKSHCCNNCSHGKPCNKDVRKSKVKIVGRGAVGQDSKFVVVDASSGKPIEGILPQRLRTEAVQQAEDKGHEVVNKGGTNADVESPVNDPTDRYGKVQIPKVMGSLRLRDCVKQRIKDGVKYEDAVKFCSNLIGESETQPKPPPPRMRRSIKATDPAPGIKVGDSVNYRHSGGYNAGGKVTGISPNGDLKVYWADFSPGYASREQTTTVNVRDVTEVNEKPYRQPGKFCRRCKGKGVVAKGRKCPRCKGRAPMSLGVGDEIRLLRKSVSGNTPPGTKVTFVLYGLRWEGKVRSVNGDQLRVAVTRTPYQDQMGNDVYLSAQGNVDIAKGRAPVITKPFADYADFDDCVAKNRDKKDPQAYCGSIQNQVEGKAMKPKQKQDVRRLVKATQHDDGRWSLQLVNSGHGDKSRVNTMRFNSRDEAEKWAGVKGYLLGQDDSKTLKSKGKLKAAPTGSIRPGNATLDRKREQLAQNTGAGVPGKVSAGLNEASGTAGGYLVNSDLATDAKGSDPDSDTDTAIGYARCPECVGTGNCSNCGGVGQIGDRTPISRAKPDTIRDCEVCGGSGDCKTCDGSGNVRKGTAKSVSKAGKFKPKERVMVIADETDWDGDNGTVVSESPPGHYMVMLDSGERQPFQEGELQSLTKKGNKNMATKTKGRRRKASVDEPFKPDPSSTGSGAGADSALNVTKDPIMDDPSDPSKSIGSANAQGDTAGGSAVWQPTPLRIAMLTRQLRKMGEWLQKEISGMDNLDGGKALLQKIHDDWNAPYTDALSKALADNYSDQGYDLDKMCKDLESDGAGATDPTGEAQLVDAGQQPPDSVEQGVAPEAMPFAGEESDEEEFLEGEHGEDQPYNKDLLNPGNPDEMNPGSDPDAGLKDLTDMGNVDELKDLCPSCGEDTPGGANFCPSCGGAIADGTGSGVSGNGDKSIDGYDVSNPDTTDVDKTGMAAVPDGTGDDPANVQPAPFNKDGVGDSAGNGAPTDPDVDEIYQRYQTPKGWRTRKLGNVRYGNDGRIYAVGEFGKALSDEGNRAEMKPGAHGPGEGQIIIGSGMLKDMADGLDQIGSGVTGVNQAALSGYSASLRKLMKDLADPGPEADATGAGPHITDPGNPEELKDSTGTGDSVDEGKTPFQGDDTTKSAEDYMKEIKQMFTDEWHFARTRGLDLSKLTLPN